MEAKKQRPGRPASEVATRTISVRIPEEAVSRLSRLAELREVTPNYMARIIILRGLNQDYSLETAMSVDKVVKDIISNIK